MNAISTRNRSDVPDIQSTPFRAPDMAVRLSEEIWKTPFSLHYMKKEETTDLTAKSPQ